MDKTSDTRSDSFKHIRNGNRDIFSAAASQTGRMAPRRRDLERVFGINADDDAGDRDVSASNDNLPDLKMPATRIGTAGWFAIFVLAGFLLVAIWYAVHAWKSMPGGGISVAGWIFLALGIVITTLVGAGLMGLVFYSSRKNFDQ